MPPGLLRCLLWLDARPACSWALVGLGAAATLLAAWPRPSAGIPPPRRAEHWRAWLFWVAAAFTLAACRWPTWFDPGLYNHDENQFVAQALSLARGAVILPWRDWDGATSGPLNTWPLALPFRLGLPPSLGGARIVAAGVILGGLAGVYLALRAAWGETAARLGILPALGFYGLTADRGEFLTYGSEGVPAALLALAVAALVRMLDAQRSARTAAWQAGLAGVALGATPFAKLQAALPAAALALAGGLLLLLLPHAGGPGARPLSGRRRCLGWLAVGGLLPAGALLGALAVGGGLPDFWLGYVLMPLQYMATGYSVSETVAAFWRTADFMAFALPCLGIAVVAGAAGIFWKWRGPGVARPFSWLAWIWWAASLYAALSPRRGFPHYLLLCVLPTVCLAGGALGGMLFQAASNRGAQRAVVVGFLLLTLTPQIWCRHRLRSDLRGQLPAHLTQRPGPVAQAILQVLPPGGRLAVWGWAPGLFIETGAGLGTRDAETEFQIRPGPLQQRYRERFLADLQRRRPAVFVDVVAPGQFAFTDRATQGFEVFPALAAEIAAAYTLAGEVGGVRIFRRNAALP